MNKYSLAINYPIFQQMYKRTMCASVAHYSGSEQSKPGKCRTKPYLCLLTSALLDNTFLVGQRGNIQTGSPQLFFRYLSNKSPFKRQGVRVCVRRGWGSCFKQTLNTEEIMPCQPNGLYPWQASHSILCLGLFSAEEALCSLLIRFPS